MRSLGTAIGTIHDECQRIDGVVEPGILTFDDLDAAIGALDAALVAVRTLDHHIFEPTDGQRYLDKRNVDGGVVRGLTAPRNAAVHYGDIIDPRLKRAVGPINGRFIIFATWLPLADVPAAAFAKTANGAVRAYDEHVAGQPVHDTLLSAFAFFDACDPTLARRNGDGSHIGFPLAPLPIPGYHRLHPDWPTHRTVESNTRARIRSEAPSGLDRTIEGYVTIDGAAELCGQTRISEGHAMSFVESHDQVVADVAGGFPYTIQNNAARPALTADDGGLRVGGHNFNLSELPDLTGTGQWLGWAELCRDNLDFYRQMRNG